MWRGKKDHRDYSDKWIAEGRCRNCGKLKPDGYVGVFCQKCRETRNRCRRRLRKSDVELGNCINCRVKLPEGYSKTKCIVCRERQKTVFAENKKKRLALGICTVCGKCPAVDGHKLCSGCQSIGADRMRKKTEALRDLGLCKDCGKRQAMPMATICKSCSDDEKMIRRIRRQKRISAGLCVACGRNKSVSTRSCNACIKRKKEYRIKIRAEVFAAYGGAVCACCGEDRVKFLEIDHINNDGGKHRRTAKGARSLCAWLKRHGYPPGFQPLCRNCNFAKFRFGRCPHEGEKREKGRCDQVGDTFMAREEVCIV